MAAEIAEQAFVAYITEKGFPPKNANQLINFSKYHKPPFIGVKYSVATKIISNPPTVDTPHQVSNPYLDSSVLQRFISSENNDKFIEEHKQVQTKSKIANAYDSYKEKMQTQPTNAMQFLGFCEQNSLHYTYSECFQYIKSMNRDKASNPQTIRKRAATFDNIALKTKATSVLKHTQPPTQFRVRALSDALLKQNISPKAQNNDIEMLQNLKITSHALSKLKNIDNDEKYELIEQKNRGILITVCTDSVHSKLNEYLESMNIKNKINVSTPENLISAHSYRDDRYCVNITPISTDPVLFTHLDIAYDEWNINIQNEFIHDLALELKVNPSQLVPICISCGSVKCIIQICNIIKDKFPFIEKKCVSLQQNTNKIGTKWKLKASKLKNWASKKLGFTKDSQRQKISILKNDEKNDTESSKLETAEKWLLNQAETLRNEIVKSLQDCPDEFEISAICVLDNDKCLNDFIQFDEWENSKLLFHGTRLQHLASIYKNGFDDKFIGSATDPGWYGRGHYFSSYPQYCMTYCEPNIFGQMTLFVSYVNLGNTFQVYDNQTYYGKALELGYQSHYVKVTASGGPAAPATAYDGFESDLYDEYVIETGKRVLPRFCVTFTKKQNVVVWRDAALHNAEKSDIMDRLGKSNVIYGALTSTDALKLIKKKKKKSSVYVITNGGDNSEGFIHSIRNELNVQYPILVFADSMTNYQYLMDKFHAVTVTVSPSGIYAFVKKYIGSYGTENEMSNPEILGVDKQNDGDENEIKIANDDNKNNTEENNKSYLNVNQNETTTEALIVIDNGSGMIKAGFMGCDVPIAVFPSVIGTDNLHEAFYVGDEALTKKCVLKHEVTLQRPIQHGIITNWDHMESLWHHTFYNELKVHPEEHSVLLTEPCFNPRANQEKMAQIMFETFNVPSMNISDAPTLSLYAAGRTTGIVCDIGYDTTQILPVIDGYRINTLLSAHKIDIGGKDLTDCLIELMKESGGSTARYAYEKSIAKMKENLCYVALNYDKELDEDDITTNWELPDGKMINVASQRVKCPEILFKPYLMPNLPRYTPRDILYNQERDGIQQIIRDSIMSFDERHELEIRRDLFANVVLSGGSTLFEGLALRLEKEVKILASAWMTVRISAPERNRKYLAWIGGALVASVSLSSNKDLRITKEEYDESGPSIVHRKGTSWYY